MITRLIAWFAAAASGLLEGEYAVECHGMTRVSKAGKIAEPSAEEPFKGVFILNEARKKAYEWADEPWEKINWCYSWDRCSVASKAIAYTLNVSITRKRLLATRQISGSTTQTGIKFR